NELRRRPHRLHVALTAVDFERASGVQDRREGRPEELGLRHEPQLPAREHRNAERPRVEVRRVVGREHVTTLGKVFDPVGTKSIKALYDRPAHAADDEVEGRDHETQSAYFHPFATVDHVKTLVIAEKPSVARDIVDALPGSFENNESYYESDDTIVTFAVGHLVELINPEEYDERFKKWRMADLPIVPEEFKLRARDKKAEKQLKVVHKLLKRDDVDRIVNACDAGREGELIFAYIYETSGVDKPVERLWISSSAGRASTTCRRCSGTPAAASASPRAGRSRQRSRSTRTRRRSPTPARAPAGSPAISSRS